MNNKLQKISLTDQVAKILITRIKNDQYTVGKQLPNENTLVADFGVSRSTIRGAIKKLEAMDYLIIRHGKGTFVKEKKSISSIISEHLQNVPYGELSEVRIILETKILQLAAARRTEEDLIEIKEKYENRLKAIKLKDPQKWMESDIEFHTSVAKASKNKILEQLYTTFMETKVRAVFELIYPNVLPLNILNEGHQEIIDCIEAQDIKGAESIVSSMTTIDKRLLK